MAQKAPELRLVYVWRLVRSGILPPPIIIGTRKLARRVTDIAHLLQRDPATNNINNNK